MSNLPKDNRPSFLDSFDSISSLSSLGEAATPPHSETGDRAEVPTQPETYDPLENMPPPVPQNLTDDTSSDSTPKSAKKPRSQSSVVDKTDQLTSLHEIKIPKDNLTKEADEEEERFIEEVEKHHGHL